MMAMARGEHRQNGFEKAFRRRVDQNHAFSTYSGRLAIYLGLRALRRLRPDRDEVLMPGLTCDSVYHAVARAGLKPVLCDVSPPVLSSQAEDFAPKVGRRTLCVISASYLGIALDMDAISNLARESGVFLLEDVASGLGARWHGKPLGSFGDLCAFSFGRGKALSTISGGMLCTASDEIRESVGEMYKTFDTPGFADSLKNFFLLHLNYLLVRPHGFYILTRFKRTFRNTHNTEDVQLERMGWIQRAIGLSLIDRLDEVNAKRIKNARAMIDILAQGRRLVTPIVGPSGGEPVFLRLPVLAASREDRDRQITALRDRGIWASESVFDPVVSSIMHPSSGFPKVRDLFHRILVLPTHPFLDAKDIEAVGEVLSAV